MIPEVLGNIVASFFVYPDFAKNEFLIIYHYIGPYLNGNQLCNAICTGCIDIAKELLANPKIDPSENNSRALYFASARNHIELVKLLLQDKRVDPTVNNFIAIQMLLDNVDDSELLNLMKDPRILLTMVKTCFRPHAGTVTTTTPTPPRPSSRLTDYHF